MLRLPAFLALAVALAGCGPSGTPVTLKFAARIGGQPFACNQSYAGVGSPATTVLGGDFRFFVSQIRLVDDTGAEVPLTLDQDGTWQVMDLALLDFEDGTGLCREAGNSGTHTVVTGRAPAGHYVGVHFTLGLPFEENLIDEATAPSPLNVSGMWWNWAGGHQFVRIDTRQGSATGNPFLVHVGNTGCQSIAGVPQSCNHVNTVDVTLMGVDPTTGTIVADLARIAAGSDPTTNAPMSPIGCQSDIDDPDCAPVFSRIGLPFGTTPAGPQQLFTME